MKRLKSKFNEIKKRLKEIKKIDYLYKQSSASKKKILRKREAGNSERKTAFYKINK